MLPRPCVACVLFSIMWGGHASAQDVSLDAEECVCLRHATEAVLRNCQLVRPAGDDVDTAICTGTDETVTTQRVEDRWTTLAANHIDCRPCTGLNGLHNDGNARGHDEDKNEGHNKQGDVAPDMNAKGGTRRHGR